MTRRFRSHNTREIIVNAKGFKCMFAYDKTIVSIKGNPYLWRGDIRHEWAIRQGLFQYIPGRHMNCVERVIHRGKKFYYNDLCFDGVIAIVRHRVMF